MVNKDNKYLLYWSEEFFALTMLEQFEIEDDIESWAENNCLGQAISSGEGIYLSSYEDVVLITTKWREYIKEGVNIDHQATAHNLFGE